MKTKSIFSIFILLYCLSISVEKLGGFHIGGQQILLPELVFLLFSVPILITTYNNRRSIIALNNPIFYAVLAYSGVVFLSWLISGQKRALIEWIGSIYFLTILGLLLINQQKSNIIYIGLIIAGCLVTFCGNIGYLMIALGYESAMLSYYPNYPIVGTVYRLTGLVRNPMMSADIIIFAIAAIYMLQNQVSVLNKHRHLLLIFLIAGLVLTFTKSMLILLGLVLILDLPRISKKYHVLAKFSGVVLITFYLFTSHFIISHTNNTDLLTKDYTSGDIYPIGQTNYAIYPTAYTATKKASLEAFANHFPFGVGGNVQQAYHYDLFKNGLLKKEFYLAPHSTYFGALGELGVLGLFTVTVLYFNIYKLVWPINIGENKWSLILFLFIVLSGVTMDNMNLRHHWLFIGIMASTYKSKEKLEFYEKQVQSSSSLFS